MFFFLQDFAKIVCKRNKLISLKLFSFRTNSFEVVGMDGVSSGILVARNSVEFNDWLKCVSANVATLNAQSVSKVWCILKLARYDLK